MGRSRGQLLREQQEDAVKKIEQIVGHADETPTQRRSFSVACADYKADVAVSRALKFRNGDCGVNPEQLTEQLPKRAGAGRKPKNESRATELRQALVAWKETPKAVRPSLRLLAAQLRTSHQLLAHYLEGLDDWYERQRYEALKRGALEHSQRIEAEAAREGRHLNMREAFDSVITPGLIDQVEEMRQDFKRGPLNRHQMAMLKIYARMRPEAQELLQKCLADSRHRKICSPKRNLPVNTPVSPKSLRTVSSMLE